MNFLILLALFILSDSLEFCHNISKKTPSPGNVISSCSEIASLIESLISSKVEFLKLFFIFFTYLYPRYKVARNASIDSAESSPVLDIRSSPQIDLKSDFIFAISSLLYESP